MPEGVDVVVDVRVEVGDCDAVRVAVRVDVGVPDPEGVTDGEAD